MIKYLLYTLLFSIFAMPLAAQNNIATYAGNAGVENFLDVTQISNGTFLVSGYATDLAWLNASVPITTLSATGISNASGTNKVGFILQLSADLQTIIRCIALPANAAEDIRFIKFSSLPYAPTADIYVSGTTKDSKANQGGYFIAKLNNNFVNGVPTGFVWVKNVWAEGYLFENQPWDVGSDGKVVYIGGQSHAADWSQVYRLSANGVNEVVPQWRTHWNSMGSEFRGLVSSYTGANPLSYSGIVLKRNGRCDLRSWTLADYHLVQSDGNGGTKKGKWPMDFMFNAPCDTITPNNTTSGPGYNGYKPSSSQTYGGQSVVIDRRNNYFYIGMNTKTVIVSSGLPDFEPAVIAMDNNGGLQWWSRLYHEIKPNGDTTISTPDQYIDGLAIDYANNNIVVNARCHGNNVENFWEGNTVAAHPTASGFQNQFTGTKGDIHISWLGKLKLIDGNFEASTYVAEYPDTTVGLGSVHPDPNMDNWPNPNAGWPNVNTTRINKNTMRVSTNGDVIVSGVGRRVMTTANAHQKMVKQLPIASTNKSSWSQFVREYSSNLSVLKYSSLVNGKWDTLTGANGDNTVISTVYKSTLGLVSVGKHSATASTTVASGNPIPVQNVTPWGNATPNNESAILVYYKAPNILNYDDSIFSFVSSPLSMQLEFIGFKNNTINTLQWKNKNEENIAYYEIEKSIDGVNFGGISGMIYKNEQHIYSIDDAKPNAENNYYRLKMVNENNEITYSNIVVLYNYVPNDIRLFPNPAHTSVKIQFTEKIKSASITISSAVGNIMINKPITANEVEINIAQWQPGIYIVKAINGNEIIEKKLVVTH
jgi:Secretion system C-terminal sorting domain